MINKSFIRKISKNKNPEKIYLESFKRNKKNYYQVIEKLIKK